MLEVKFADDLKILLQQLVITKHMLRKPGLNIQFFSTVYFHFQNEYVVIWTSICKTLHSFQILRTSEHEILVFENDLCCMKLYLKNARKSGNYFKGQTTILLNLKLTIYNF